MIGLEKLGMGLLVGWGRNMLGLLVGWEMDMLGMFGELLLLLPSGVVRLGS